MDFHSLPRRDLQALCKKNKIPANMTNVAMADALHSLDIIEWAEEIKPRMMPGSPLKNQESEPDVCLSENQGSPLPRSRRVTAKALETLAMEQDGQAAEKEQEEDPIKTAKTPATRRGRKPQGTATRKQNETTETPAIKTQNARTATARRRAVKKQDEQEDEQEKVQESVVETPAVRRSQRVAAAAAQKVTETPASVTVSRSRRQTSRRLAESATGRRATRATAKMMTLDPEEEISEVIEPEKYSAPVLNDKFVVEEEKEEEAIQEVCSKDGEEIKEGENEQCNDKSVLENIDQEQEEQQIEIIEPEKDTTQVSDEKLDSVEDQVFEEMSPSEQINDQEEEQQTEVMETKKDSPPVSDEEIVDSPPVQSMDKELSSDDVEDKEEIKEEIKPMDEPEQVISEQADRLPSLDDSPIRGVVSEADDHVQDLDLPDSPTEITLQPNHEPTISDDPPLPLVDTRNEESGPNNDEEESVDELSAEIKEGRDEVPAVSPAKTAPAMAGDQIEADRDEVPAVSPAKTAPAMARDQNEVERDEVPAVSPAKTAPAMAGDQIEKMLESVVRHLANAKLHDSASNFKSKRVVVKKMVPVVSGDAELETDKENRVESELTSVKDESQVTQTKTEPLDLNGMSLRKLRSTLKEKLTDLNNMKGVEGGRRLALSELNENLVE